jgi:hypothetical protein
MTIYELGDIDFFDYQLKYIRKNFQQLLEKEEYIRESDFIQVLDKIETSKAQKTIQKFLNLHNNNEANNDIINYYEWLNTKLKKGNQ